MLFSTNIFLFSFLPLVLWIALPLHAILKNKNIDNALIIIASCFFYYWGSGKFFFLFALSICFNYFLGYYLYFSRNDPARRYSITGGIAINLGFLFYFKYWNFFYAQASELSRVLFGAAFEPIAQIFLPIGISFYTFMAVSYLVETYKRETRASSIIDFATYFTMFPHLVAGPIVRYSEIKREMEERRVNSDMLFEGLVRFAIGLGKKAIIADTLGVSSDKIFALPGAELSTHLAWLGALCYTLQIYFDFSGYSDMAIGLARFLGFVFPENFDAPYRSKSITEFWRRWHMTLSFWFRDFLYIPLGGNRVKPFRNYLNLLLVFFLCGLWHGASWHFVVWGLMHGGLLIIERIGRIHFGWKQDNWWNLPLTFLLTLLSWIMFRATSVENALNFYRSMFGFPATTGFQYYRWSYFLPRPTVFLFVIGLIVVFVDFERLRRLPLRINRDLLRGSYAIALVLLSVVFLSKGVFTPFIYFQF